MPFEDAERLKQAELDRIAKQAQETLERGVERMRKEVTESSPVTYTLLVSELSLAQIYIGSGQSAKAVKLLALDHPADGPLPLVQSSAAIVQQGNFGEETYKAALRAYLGTQQMKEAEAMMDALDAHVAAKGGDEATLTRIYITLGRELGEQVQALRDNTERAAELDIVLKGFEAFLNRIAGRDEGNTYSELNWVGDTFYNMASTLDDGDALPEQAKKYYSNASTTYQGMIARMKEGKIQPPTPDAAVNLEIRLTMCQRRLGNYQDAIDRLKAILVKNPRMMEAQRQGAYTYAEWAVAASDPNYYQNAIDGGLKDKANGPNIIWGWAQIAGVAMRNKNMSTMFHEARYNLAECRYKKALASAGAARTELLTRAAQDVSFTHALSPQMGGEEQYRKYDKLLKTIQHEAGQKEIGLAGVESAAAKAPPN